ncbi:MULTISPECIES: DUF6088 family protein [Pseudomonas]|uniref:DUF6088 family protein n=1 Tax=Pseudomonas TaxID=286 RepID=UPI0016492063|nr:MULTISPECIES: DUF6088 family protein [Pseudomonas]QXH94295.1 S-adenosylhomocysteine hydrolase [Pseudomonas zarinae]
MVIQQRLKRSISRRKEGVFLRSEFSGFGSPAQVSRALRYLIAKGVLVKLGVGVFAKAKPSILTGKPIPARPLEVLAPLVLQKLGIKVTAGRAVQEYNVGDSLQLPAGIVFDTGSRRINRKLGFGDRYVCFEKSLRLS